MKNSNVAEAGKSGVAGNVNAVPPGIPQNRPALAPVQSNSAKNVIDLSQLLELGKIDEVVEAFGVGFQIHTLTAGENSELMHFIKGIEEDLSAAMQLRIATLAFAVTTVNEVPLEQLYIQQPGDAPDLSAYDKKRWIISQWQQALTNHVFDKYSKLLEKSQKMVDNLGN